MGVAFTSHKQIVYKVVIDGVYRGNRWGKWRSSVGWHSHPISRLGFIDGVLFGVSGCVRPAFLLRNRV